MLPYGVLEKDRPLIRLPFTHFAMATVLLALTGLLACLATSLLAHSAQATSTHCHVDNYLPSISASISLVPERYIWRCCIGLHSAPRYLVAMAYYSFYRARLAGLAGLADRLLAMLALLLSLAENSGLLVLTYVASTETYSVHKTGFMVFGGCALLHMVATCRLWLVLQANSGSPQEVTSYTWKRRLTVFSVFCVLAAAYFYRRHNKHCEAGVYSLFALCEYLLVFSNMAFHMTAFWDFGSREVLVATPPEVKLY